MGMFDYFSNRAKLLRQEHNTQRRPEDAIRERLMARLAAAQPLMAPERQFGNEQYGTGSAPVESADVARPRLVAPVPPAPGTVPVMSEAERRLQAARLKTAGYRDITGPPVYDEAGRQISGKPVNNDHGILGRVGDILREAVISAGDAYNNSSGDPGQRLMAAAGAGIAGGFGGGFKPTLDEERQRLRNIAISEGEEQRQLGIMGQDTALAGQQAAVAYQQARPILEANETAARLAGTAADMYKTRVNGLFERYKANPTFDPNSADPEVVKMMLEARELGVALPKREPGEDYFLSWSPDGRAAKIEKNSGRTSLEFGGQSFKPEPTVSPSDISEDRFPWLMTDKQARLKALEEIDPAQEGMVLNDQTVNDLVNYSNSQGLNPYKNEDGSFNKNKFLQDLTLDLAPVQYGSLYRTQARNIANKVARRERQLLNSGSAGRAEFEKFKLAIKGKPVSQANEAADYFNRIMRETKPGSGARRDALAEFYKQLS